MDAKKNFIINVIFTLIIVTLGFLFIRYLLPALMPFVLAYLLAYIAICLSKRVIKRDNRWMRIVCLLVVYLLIGVLITSLIVVGVNKIIEYFAALPDFYTHGVEPFIGEIKKFISSLTQSLPRDVYAYLSTFVDGLFATIQTIVLSVSTSLVSYASPIVTGAPALLIDIMVVIVASFYFVVDFELVNMTILKLMNKRVRSIFDEVSDYVRNKLLKIIWSYIKIMSITFVELVIGLWIMGVDNAIIISLLTALLDILPVLGVGTVLIPWGVIALCLGKYGIGIGVLLLYMVITLIRNVLEPKLVGDDLGLHPLPTLIAMMLGLDLFGIVGMFGLPLVLSFFLNQKKAKNNGDCLDEKGFC